MSNPAVSAAVPGTLAGVGNAATALGSAVTAFVLANPVVVSLAAGAALGAGAYWSIGRLLSKKEKGTEEAPAAT